MQLSNYLPTSGAKLDAIKIAALLAMVIGHVNLVYFDDEFLPIAMLGRGWFSLFCYTIACSVLRIQEQKKDFTPYIVSILILAVITQPFYNIAFELTRANALFTLATGAVFAFYFDKLSSLMKVSLFAFAFIDATMFSSAWEYSVAGTMIPVAFLMILKDQKYGIACFLLMLFCANISPISEYNTVVTWLISGVLTFIVAIIGFIFFFFVPAILCPDKEKRLLPRYAMHVFYPAHLLILGITAPFVKALFI